MHRAPVAFRPEASILAAWQSQLAQARGKPGLLASQGASNSGRGDQCGSYAKHWRSRLLRVWLAGTALEGSAGIARS